MWRRAVLTVGVLALLCGVVGVAAEHLRQAVYRALTDVEPRRPADVPSPRPLEAELPDVEFDLQQVQRAKRFPPEGAPIPITAPPLDGAP